MTEAILQFGGLGLAAYVIVWLTRSLNGKLDTLNAHLRENTGAVRELTGAVERSGRR